MSSGERTGLEHEDARAIEEALLLIAWMQPDGRIRTVGPQWAKVGLGAPAGETLALASIFHEADLPRVSVALERLGREAVVTFDVRLRPGEGGKPAPWVRFRAAREVESGEVRLAGLEITDLKRDAAASAENAATIDLMLRVLNSAPVILWSCDKDGYGGLSEGKALELLGLKRAETKGLNVLDMYRGSPIEDALRSALQGNEMNVTTEPVPGLFFDNWIMPLRDPETNELAGAIGLAIHASGRVTTERELREKIALIGRQSETIRALATPIISVWDEVLVLPVIGTVDSQRTADMMDSLLGSIVREKARFTIVDLTGVEVVDTSTADHIIKLFKSAKVLGVEGVLCGIQPLVAQTVIALGVDLGSVRTMRTLQDALRWCMAARDRRKPAKSRLIAEAAE